ncbi:CpaF family protein [Glacieibacterium sp.]|uniref:CpaF family protein n=1 Tax=Glacieibacterium sp. TaxID=2860237 RepID=UPI003AFF83BD
MGPTATTAEPDPLDTFSISDAYQATKFKLFDIVLELLEARAISADAGSARQIRKTIDEAINAYGLRDGLALNSIERVWLADDIYHEITGLGPLEPLLRDPLIDDIIVNGARQIYVERAGKLALVKTRFRDDAHLMTIIQRIVSPIGRRVDEASPYVDARLADGSRVNVIIPPIALDGPILSIRKFRPEPIVGAEYVRTGAMNDEMLDFLSNAVESRLNILICGGTGSGKTTLLNMLSSYIGDSERLITIEDAAELRLRQTHVVRLETRPPTLEGTREVNARDLVRNALRMRPDRIILGEVRGAEAVEMLQAMSTGHDGSMATVHANTDRDALSRIEMLLGFGGLQADLRTLRRYIASSIQLIIHVQRTGDGRRRVSSITEVIGLEGDTITLNQLYRFAQASPLSGEGVFETVSRRPFFAFRLRRPVATAPQFGAA